LFRRGKSVKTRAQFGHNRNGVASHRPASSPLQATTPLGLMKSSTLFCKLLIKVVSRAGLEPATHWLKVRTIPLSAVFSQYQKSQNLSFPENQKGYYLIDYRPDESTFDRKTGRRTFHKLSLKVTRAGKFEVRMRNGFFGVTDQEARATPRTPQEQVVEALTSPFHTNGVHLQLTSF